MISFHRLDFIDTQSKNLDSAPGLDTSGLPKFDSIKSNQGSKQAGLLISGKQKVRNGYVINWDGLKNIPCRLKKNPTLTRLKDSWLLLQVPRTKVPNRMR